MEKIWLKNYPAGIAAEINPDPYPSIPDLLAERWSNYAGRPAFASFGTELTFAELNTQAIALAAVFQQILNMQKGDRIALMLPNVLQYPIAMLAALRAGLIVVNVNPLYTVPELVHQLQDSGATAIIVLANFAQTVQQALLQVNVPHVMVTYLGDVFPRPKAWVLDGYLRHIKHVIPDFHLSHVLRWRELMAQAKSLHLTPVTLAPDDIAFLQYTGGTTGVAKGAMLTHGNIVANILQAEAWFLPLMTGEAEIMITALPLYHIFSLLANCLLMMRIGALSVLIINPRDLAGMIKDFKRYRFSMITGVNTLFNALLKAPGFNQLDFSRLKFCLGGGMAVQRAVAEKWQTVTGRPLLEAYGLTETSPCVASDPVTQTEYNGSIGVPMPSTDVCVLDDNHQEVALGEVGELAVKGPQVMAGYWHNPAETAKVFTKEGWLLTGDIVSIDAHGDIFIRERKKDMILVSGFNVYPNEIENVIAAMPGVREVAVVGVADENSGEAVKAFVVCDPGVTLDAAAVIAWCRTQLTGYKLPRSVAFCDELPKSNVGKVLRRLLREQGRQQDVSCVKPGAQPVKPLKA